MNAVTNAAMLDQAARLSVAPMMAWTDSLCRQFHRTLTRKSLLYTEMVTAAALVHGNATHLLDHDPAEHPLAVQLGGSDPHLLKQAARICRDAGYAEVNLNVGCPSDRVQSGAFGAVLMKSPDVVRACLEAMQDVDGIIVTVKCRIGVDDQSPQDVLPAFLDMVRDTGVHRVAVHARKAWLQGLSPKENRDIPPLDYPLVFAMKQAFPSLHISLNGGVCDLKDAAHHLGQGLDGVMIGRAAYHDPAQILLTADGDIFGAENPHVSVLDAAVAMEPILAAHLERGGRMHQLTRHMLGLFAGLPGARHWRRRLSEAGADPNADLGSYRMILAEVRQRMSQADTAEPQRKAV